MSDSFALLADTVLELALSRGEREEMDKMEDHANPPSFNPRAKCRDPG